MKPCARHDRAGPDRPKGARNSGAPAPVCGAISRRVALLDDDPGSHLLLGAQFRELAPDWSLECHVDAERALPRLALAPPTVVLMDLWMPKLSGSACTRRLKSVLPGVPIIMLTGCGDPNRIVQALLAGADGYVVKPSLFAELKGAILKVQAGFPALCPVAEQALLKFVHHAGQAAQAAALSERERDILGRLASGQRDKDIARHLGVSHRTVEAHLRRLYAKLGVHGRQEAVRRFLGLEPASGADAEEQL